MDTREMDEDQQCLNLELFLAVNNRSKRLSEEQIIDKVKECLGDGADIDAVNLNHSGNTVLHVAILHHYCKVIRFLLENGARVDVKNNQGLTALTLAHSLNYEQETIVLLENHRKSITSKSSITYRSKTQPDWNKLRSNSEIAVLEVNSVELSPDFLQQVEFYDAIDTAGNLFFVDVIVSDTANIDEDFIIRQLNRLNKQLILQCGSLTNTKVYYKGCEGVVNVISLASPTESYDENVLTDKLSRKSGFGIDLIVEALRLNLVGKFESERISLLNVSFDLEKHFNNLKLIDHAIKCGDVLTVRLLSLSHWNLSKPKASTLSLATECGNVEKLAAVLRVNFPIQLNDNIGLPKDTAAHFDMCKKQMLESAVRAGNCDIISFMIRCSVELDEDIIQLAWDYKLYEVVLLMLKADCVFPYHFDLQEGDVNDANFIELRSFIEERDQLHDLIKEGQSNSVKEFLKLIAPSKLYLDKENRSAVYKALKFNHFNVFVWLKSEVNAEFKDDMERRCLGVGVLDSATDALLPHFIPIDNAHILHLVAKSRSHRHYDGFKEHIESIYTELNTISQISTVMKVIQFCDHVDIIYDFEKDSIVDVNVASSENVTGFCDYKAGRIYIGAKVTKQDLLGTVAHELTHLAIQTIYDNACKPYKLGDLMEDDFDEMVKEIRKQSIPVDSIIGRAFSCYGEGSWASELIVRVNHMLAYYGSTDGLSRLKVQAKSLLEFYTKNVEKRFENLVSESHLIKPRYLIKLLNDNAGIIRKIDDSKINLKKCIDVREVFGESEVQIAVVTSTSPFLSTMSVYQNLKEISQQPNSFMIFNFDGYVKRRIEINQAFYSDVCDFLVLLCESGPEKSILSQSLKGLAQVLWKKSNKRVILIMENCELSNDEVTQLVNLSLVIHSDVEYTLDDVRVESAKLLLDESVSLQCRDANIKLSSLIDEEHYKLVDAQTLFKLINKQPIVIGKQIGSSSHYDAHFYVDRLFSHQAVIKEEILRYIDESTMYAISEIDEETLGNLVERKDSVCTFSSFDNSFVGKYVMVDSRNGSQEYRELCQQFPQLNIHWLKKVSGGFHWLQSRCINGNLSQLKEYVSDNSVYQYSEDKLAIQDQMHRVFIVSDTAGMGKSTVLSSLALRLTENDLPLWVIRVNLNDYTKVLEEEHEKHSFETHQSSKALYYFVERLLCYRVESRLETEFERKLLLHFLQHNEDRVVIMFDGFDEIKERHQSVIKDVLVALRSSKVKQLWVTTRPHMRETLENTLHHLSYTLQPFNEAEQANFLTRFWGHRLNLDVKPGVASDCISDTKLQCFAETLIKLLSQSISDREKEFTGVPLQLRMIAECFEEDVEMFCKSDEYQSLLPPKLKLNDLYQNFFIRKYKIFQSEKNKLDSTKPNMETQDVILRNHFLDSHRFASLFILFDEEECQLLLTRDEFNSGATFISEFSSNKWNTGIIDSIIEGKPRFVHLTFAEYLTAEFIVNLLAKEPQTNNRIAYILRRVLFGRTSRVVRAFINTLLGKTGVSEDVLNMNRSELGSELLEMRRRDYDVGIHSHTSRTLFHFLAEGGDAHLVDILLICLETFDIGAIEFVPWFGMKPLHVAAKNGHLDVVKVLVEHKADVNAQVFLIGDLFDRFNALLLAAYKGHTNVCKWLIKKGADITAIKGGTGHWIGHNVLHMAAEGGHLDLVKILKNVNGIDFNTVVEGNMLLNGRNALHIAASAGQWDVVKWIISDGLIDVNVTTSPPSRSGQTVLTMAVKQGPPELVQWLIEHQADVSIGFDNKNIGRDYKKNTALHIASKRNILEIVVMLVSKSADVNAVNDGGQAPLHVSAASGSDEIVEYLLKIKGVDINAKDGSDNTPLHLAAGENRLKAVEMLLGKSAAVNAVNCDGQTPLHMSAASGFEEIVKSLLKLEEVDINVADGKRNTPLHLAAKKNMLKAVEMLLSKGASVNAVNCDGQTPLHLGSAWGSEEIVDSLLKITDVDVVDQKHNTPLHLAAKINQLKNAEILLSKGANVNAVNCDKQTPLHLAAKLNQLRNVEILLSKGANVNAVNCDGQTPLLVGTMWGSEEIVISLLKIEEIDVNVVDNGKQDTPLHLATDRNMLKAVEMLLSRGASVNAVNRDGQTPLHLGAACSHKKIQEYLLKFEEVNVADGKPYRPLHLLAYIQEFRNIRIILSILSILLSKGANFNAVNCDGQTPLHLAVVRDGGWSDELVEYLLKIQGVGVNIADKKRNTPLHLAVKRGESQVVRMLLNKGASVNVVNCDRQTPLHVGARFGSEEMVEFLVTSKEVDIDVTDEKCNTPLHLAVAVSQLKNVKMLLSKGANVNAVNCDGQTPLHLAVLSDGFYSHEVVKYLLEIEGVGVNIADKKHNTPLHLAVKRGESEAIRMLLNKGASVNAVNCDGQTPLEFVRCDSLATTQC